MSASISARMKPRVSLISRARPTFAMGRWPTSTRRPDWRASCSVMPHAPDRRVGEERIARIRSLMPRESSSSRCPATISKSLYAVCVNAPRPLHSPMAQIAVHAGAAPIVHRHVAARVHGDAGRVQSKVIGIGPSSDGQQHVAAVHGRLSVRAVHAHRHAGAASRERDAAGRQPERDALVLEDGLQLGGDVLVLARDQAGRAFDHRHAAAEPAVDLRELQSDVAATDDDQVLGEGVERQQARVREERHVGYAGHIGHERAPADVDEDLGSLEDLAVDLDGARPGEAPVTLE
ncbi:MAG: hypothetical protein R2712_30330 [Vicinamibacterales bacterium]